MYRPLLATPGRLAIEMRWRVATLIAVCGIAGLPALSNAAQLSGAPMLHVSVNPPAGSAGTHFAVSFRAAETTGRIGSTLRYYRVTASDQGRSGCRSSVTAQAPPAKIGSKVRVVLSPGLSDAWCAGTFRGTLWAGFTVVCGPVQACPDIVAAPRMVGKFTFRVTRG
jgi:hypothetical protein